MGRRLAGRLHAVMAAVAASDDGGMIHESDSRPASRYVAVRALAGRCDMVGGFERGTQQATPYVAARAGGVSWPEYAAGMARVAGKRIMGAVQDKARAEMIESLL